MEPLAPPRRGRARTARRLLLGLVAATVTILGTAAPASAHGLGGPAATDQRVSVDGLRPPLPGVSVRAVDLGAQLELTNRGSIAVIVLGYEGEPYLRVGPRGVEVNRRSPATALNRTATPTGRAPVTRGAGGAPEWERTGTEPTVRWHDHRAHWMGRGSVRGLAWSIPVRRGAVGAEIVGTVTTETAPSPWPWLAAAAGLTGLTALAGRSRRWPAVLAAAIAVLAASETLHLVGAWGAWESSVAPRLLGAAPSGIAVAACVAALAHLGVRRRDPDAATPTALLAGVFTALAGGLADLGSLTHAILPSTLAPWVVRATVVVALGIGIGVTIVAAQHLRPRPRTVADGEPAVSG